MSKAVVLIFFIAAVIIFYIYKYASKGIKKAYKHTMPQDAYASALGRDEEKIERIVHAMLALIGTQTTFAYDQYGILIDGAKDNWSIGYVGGFADATLQQARIGTDNLGHIIMLKFFCGVFGEKEGLGYFKKYSSLMEDRDEDAVNGSGIAGNEIFNQYSSNGKLMPLELMKHIAEKRFPSN